VTDAVNNVSPPNDGKYGCTSASLNLDRDMLTSLSEAAAANEHTVAAVLLQKIRGSFSSMLHFDDFALFVRLPESETLYEQTKQQILAALGKWRAAYEERGVDEGTPTSTGARVNDPSVKKFDGPIMSQFNTVDESDHSEIEVTVERCLIPTYAGSAGGAGGQSDGGAVWMNAVARMRCEPRTLFLVIQTEAHLEEMQSVDEGTAAFLRDAKNVVVLEVAVESEVDGPSEEGPSSDRVVTMRPHATPSGHGYYGLSDWRNSVVLKVGSNTDQTQHRTVTHSHRQPSPAPSSSPSSFSSVTPIGSFSSGLD
jgi:hypothetical protein